MGKRIIFTILLLLTVPAQGSVLLLFHGAVKVENFRNLGPYDTTTDTNNLLLDVIDEKAIEIQSASLGRIERLLQAQDNICAINRIKTPARERTSYFSKPINLYLSMRLYYPATLKVPSELLNDDGRLISMTGLFDAMPRKILGLTQDRSYGEVFDDMLVGVKVRHLFVRGGGDTFISMVTLMEKGRFDFLLEYPETIKRARKGMKQMIKLKSLEVAGTTRYIVGHIECSKSPLAQGFLKQVDSALEKLYRTEAFKKAHTYHLDKADIGRFNRYYQEVYLK